MQPKHLRRTPLRRFALIQLSDDWAKFFPEGQGKKLVQGCMVLRLGSGQALVCYANRCYCYSKSQEKRT